MFSHLLPVVLDTAQEYIEALVPAALDGKLSLEGLNTLCANYRRRAICCLLLTLDKEEFAVALADSGEAGHPFRFMPAPNPAHAGGGGGETGNALSLSC